MFTWIQKGLSNLLNRLFHILGNYINYFYKTKIQFAIHPRANLDHLNKSGQTLNMHSSDAIVKTIQNMYRKKDGPTWVPWGSLYGCPPISGIWNPMGNVRAAKQNTTIPENTIHFAASTMDGFQGAITSITQVRVRAITPKIINSNVASHSCGSSGVTQTSGWPSDFWHMTVKPSRTEPANSVTTHSGVAKEAIANTSAAKQRNPPTMTNLSMTGKVFQHQNNISAWDDSLENCVHPDKGIFESDATKLYGSSPDYTACIIICWKHFNILFYAS